MQKFLVIGLGNIGEKYANTRHNIGFKVVEYWALKRESSWEKTNFGELAKTKFRGRQVLCLKPNTYMNLSGKAVLFWMKKENIQIENLLIITDDIHIDFGLIKLKTKGSSGGHNGMISVEHEINTSKYNRMRIGVGNNFETGNQIDFVLGNWTEEENKNLEKIITRAVAAIESYVFQGMDRAMNQYNTKISLS